MKKYEVFDTTADIGLRAWGGDLEELCINLLEGFYCIIFDREFYFSASDKNSYKYAEIRNDSAEELIISLLEDAVFYIYAEETILYPVAVTENSLYYRFIRNLYPIETEIKAVTRHHFRVELGKTCMVEVIFDI